MHTPLHDKLRRYRIALFIGISTWLLQALVYALLADSKALLGDALHNLADNIVLLGVVLLTMRELAHQNTHSHVDRYFTKSAILLLWVSALFVLLEGVERVRAPEAFPGMVVLIATIIAGLGSWSAHRLISRVHESVQDHKHEASVLHVLGDLIISVIVATSVLLTMLFAMPAIDGWGAILASLWMFVRGIMLWREVSHQHHH
jgi:Co/Zn/Cd efflux system component